MSVRPRHAGPDRRPPYRLRQGRSSESACAELACERELYAAFREDLAKLGWVEVGNLRIGYRASSADPGRLGHTIRWIAFLQH